MQVAPKTCMHSSSAFACRCGSVLHMHEDLSWVLEVVVGASEMATNGGADWMPVLRYSSHQPSDVLHQVVTSWPFNTWELDILWPFHLHQTMKLNLQARGSKTLVMTST